MTDMYADMLAAAEADLRKANTNVDLRRADMERAQAAYTDALEQQAKMEATFDWLRERLRDRPKEPALAPVAQPPAGSTAKPAPTLFGKPMPEVTNTGLCLRALGQLGKTANTREVRDKVRELGHDLDQGQVRGALKYLARLNGPVENPEPGVWLLKRSSDTASADAALLPLAARES